MLNSIRYVVVILTFSAGNLLIAEDKIRARLDSALSKYDATVSESREEVISFFDKRTATARKKGDARQVAAINEEREQFEKIGKVPEGLPRNITSKLAGDRQKLAEAYKATISAYTRANQDEAAKALQQEYDEFLASGDFGSQSNGIPLFNAKDLTGWRGLPAMWRVSEGAIVGSNKPGGLQFDTFLVSDKIFADFELRCKVKVSPGCNSGIQIRSTVIDRNSFQVNGPQVEFGEGGAVMGSLYGQGTGRIQVVNSAILNGVIRQNDFNDVFVRCKGAHITIKVNTVTTIDNDFPDLPLNGIIGFQLHKVKTGTVYVKDVLLTDLSRDSK